MEKYSRICPDCNDPINYGTYKVFWKARKNNSTCRLCFYKSLIGTKLSNERKLKIGIANSIALIGNIPSNKGIAMTKEQRLKLSKIHVGMKYSEETRKKHRINCLKRLEKYGIPSNQDLGAREFFELFNKNNNTNFKPQRFWDLGYDADGYDASIHTWMEFDPPHHFNIDGTLKEKDIIRQTNIITHFESLGNPLNEFIRVRTNKHRLVIETKSIYKGKK